ncbi:hypothetical protein NDA12_004535 [Ustilago hordei]|nr:hypothetical protein NDA12_004535 [Ustilago hordei]
MDLSHSEDQAGGGDESMIGDPHTPTPAPRPRRSVSFNLDEQEDINYEKYASPTGPRYVKTKLDPYSRTRTDPYPLDHEEDTSIMAELNQSKPIATPFPKFNPRDMEIFILEAEAWFKFNQVYEQSRMINHMGAQCHGPGCSRSRRVTGSYGRSTGIEDLVDTSREHGRSAVSMETMDSYGFTCKGALSPYARRTRHSHEEDQAQRAGAAMRRTKLRWLPLRGSRDRKSTQVMRRRSSVEGVDTGHEEEEQCRRSRHHSRGTGVSSPDIDRTEGSSPLRSGDHFKHQVNTLDTRVDATNLITNTINLIIIDATNLITNTINLIIIDITNLITNTINLIIINTHTRPWCHHNIDIDRAELPLNGVSTEVSRNLR